MFTERQIDKRSKYLIEALSSSKVESKYTGCLIYVPIQLSIVLFGTSMHVFFWDTKPSSQTHSPFRHFSPCSVPVHCTLCVQGWPRGKFPEMSDTFEYNHTILLFFLVSFVSRLWKVFNKDQHANKYCGYSRIKKIWNYAFCFLSFCVIFLKCCLNVDNVLRKISNIAYNITNILRNVPGRHFSLCCTNFFSQKHSPWRHLIPFLVPVHCMSCWQVWPSDRFP